MAAKGMTNSGEAFCMACGAGVDVGAPRCESCYSQLDEEVKAFKCPRCGKVLELGMPQCPKCSMKFKAKAVRPSDEAEDQRMVSRLIDWSRRVRPERTEPAEEQRPAAAALGPEEEAAVSDLVRRVSELADLRSGLASAMADRLSGSKGRASGLAKEGPSSIDFDSLEGEVSAVSEDVRGAEEFISMARAVSEELDRVLSMPGVRSILGDRGISLTVPASSGGATDDSLREREEQVRKREEMVDRKIKAYAQKKKELDVMEASLSPTASAGAAIEKRQASLAYKVRTIHELVSAEGACDDIDPCLSSLEGHLRGLVVSRSQLEQRMAQMQEGEEEVRVLLRALDDLLGHLPTDVVERFRKTEEFRLYERVLDRLHV